MKLIDLPNEVKNLIIETMNYTQTTFQRRINVVSTLWMNVQTTLYNVDTTLYQRCCKVASTSAKLKL